MENEKNLKKKRIAVIVIGAILVGVVITLYFTLGKQIISLIGDNQSFEKWLDKFGRWDEVVFVSVRALQTVVKFIPAEPLEIGSGYAYGTWGGLLYCMLGTEIGSLIILLLTRLFGMKIINLFVSKEKFEKLKFLQNEKKILVTLFFIYLIPGTPKDLITYFAGKLKIKIPTFLIVTGIGRIPSIITSTWCGAALGEKNITLAVIVFGVTFVVSIIGMLFYKKFFETKDASEKVEKTES